MARLGVCVFFLLWAALVLYGFYAYATTVATDMGFTRGFNRIAEFFKWQGIALIVAIIGWFFYRSAAGSLGRGLRWARRLPIILSGGFFLLIILLYGGAIFLLPK